MVKTSRWDSAEYIETFEDAVAYLNVVLEENDPQAIIYALGVISRSEGMADITKRIGLDRATLLNALDEDDGPSFITVCELLKSLGFEMQFSANKD